MLLPYSASETSYSGSSNPALPYDSSWPFLIMHRSPLLAFAPAPVLFLPVPDLSLAPPVSDCPGRCSSAMARKHSSSAFVEEPGAAEANRVLASASYMEHRSAVSGRYIACIGRHHGRARTCEVHLDPRDRVMSRRIGWL